MSVYYFILVLFQEAIMRKDRQSLAISYENGAFGEDVIFPEISIKEITTKYRLLAMRDIADRIAFGLLPWAIIMLITLSKKTYNPLAVVYAVLILSLGFLMMGRIRRNRTLLYFLGFLSYLLIIPFTFLI